MAAISTLRAGIASALTDNTKYSVFSFPPATPIAPPPPLINDILLNYPPPRNQ